MTEPARPAGWVAQVLAEQRRRWQEGDRARAETYLQTCPQSPPDVNAAIDVIYQEFVLREQAGEKPAFAEYLARFPGYEAQLRRQFALHEILDDESIVRKLPSTLRTVPPGGPVDREVAEPAGTAPSQVGGYEIEGELGRRGWERLVKWARRERGEAALSAGLVLAALLLIIGLVAFSWWESARAATERQKRRELEYQVYLMRVSKAYQDLTAGKPGWAAELLDLCPPELRGWEWHYLDRLRWWGPMNPLVEHTRTISSVAVSPPDGSLIASSSGDGTVRLWSPEGRAVGTLTGPGGSINWVAFAPDGGTLAAAGENGQVILWDPQHQKMVRKFAGHDGPVSCVAFHPVNGEVASAAFGGERAEEVLIWGREDGQLIRTLRGHTSRVVGLAYSADGKMLATASHDQTVRLWDAATGEEKRTFLEHRCPVAAVAFSPDGALVASVAGRQRGDNPDEIEVFIWQATSGKVRHRLTGDARRPVAVAFHPGGERLATAGWDGEIKLWDVATGQELLALRGHDDAVMGIAFSPDGSLLASGSLDKTVRLWRADP